MNTSKKILDELYLDEVPTFLKNHQQVKFRCYIDPYSTDFEEDYKEDLDRILEYISENAYLSLDKFKDSQESLIKYLRHQNEGYVGLIIVETNTHIYIDFIYEDNVDCIIASCFELFQTLFGNINVSIPKVASKSSIKSTNFLNFVPLS